MTQQERDYPANGPEIRRLLKVKGMKKEELASKVEVTVRTVDRWLASGRIRHGNALTLVNKLNEIRKDSEPEVSFEQLVCPEPPPSPISTESTGDALDAEDSHEAQVPSQTPSQPEECKKDGVPLQTPLQEEESEEYESQDRLQTSSQLERAEKPGWPRRSWMVGWIVALVLGAIVGEYFILQKLGRIKNDCTFPDGHPAHSLFAEADRVKTEPFVRRNQKWSMVFQRVETINERRHGVYNLSSEFEVINISDTLAKYPLIFQFEVPRAEDRNDIPGDLEIWNPGDLGPIRPPFTCYRDKEQELSFVGKEHHDIPVGETRKIKIEVKGLICQLPYSDYFVAQHLTELMELTVDLQMVRMKGSMILLRSNKNTFPTPPVPRPDGSYESMRLSASGPFLPFQGIYCTLDELMLPRLVPAPK